MFVKALFIVMKDCKILHHPPKKLWQIQATEYYATIKVLTAEEFNYMGMFFTI